MGEDDGHRNLTIHSHPQSPFLLEIIKVLQFFSYIYGIPPVPSVITSDITDSRVISVITPPPHPPPFVDVSQRYLPLTASLYPQREASP